MELEEAKRLVSVADVWRRLRPETAPAKEIGAFRSPIREERNPSFSIFAGGQEWKDHGTGESGDQVDLIEVFTGCTTSEAIGSLIEIAGGDPEAGGDWRSATTTARKIGTTTFTSTDEQAERKAKRERWPKLFRGEPRHWKALADLRKIDPRAVELASLENVLRFCLWKGEPSWAITEENAVEARFIEVRRMDGGRWPKRGGDGFKAFTLPGSEKRAVNAGNLSGSESVALVEGGGDLLGAYDFILRENRVSRVVPVALLGAGQPIPEDQVEAFRGRRVRIFQQGDGAGEKAAARWNRQLLGVAGKVGIAQLPEGKDLGDLAAEGHGGTLMEF